MEYLHSLFGTASGNRYFGSGPGGVKPLFYSYIDGTLVFGSEPKALLQHPKVEPVVGAEGLAEVFIIGPARTRDMASTRTYRSFVPAWP